MKGKEGRKLIITREIDYSIRILRTLFGTTGKVSTKYICEQERLPLQFAYRILKKMEKSGLVKIFRGTEGGVELVADLHEVTLYDVIEAIDNKRKISSCMLPGYECEWKSTHGNCYVHKNLLDMQDEMNNLLKSKFISGIISEH